MHTRATLKMPAAVVSVMLMLVLVSTSGFAQQAPADEDSEGLAKKLANPISDLVSVPFQFNWEQKVGPAELSRFILNIQPVIPFTLDKDWNLILRIIAPFVGQPPLFTGGPSAFSMGDITTSFFLSPSSKSGFTVGVGPVFVTPSSYDPTTGSGKYSAGPTAVALVQTGPWTAGTLWNQVWSFAGDETRADVNQMFLQPFVAYQASKTITLTVQSETTADWNAVAGQRWTVPINVLLSKLSTFGVFPASYQFGGGVFPVHPDLGPSWKIRAAIVVLLPRKER